MITIYKDNTLQEILYTKHVFSGGEVHVNIDTYIRFDRARIVARLQSSDDFFELALVVDALRNLGVTIFDVSIPYMPYGRQDRPCVTGDPFSLKVFATLLNSLKLDVVRTVDPHSDVTAAVIDNVKVLSQFELISRTEILSNLACDTIPVSPDAGANKKVQKIAQYALKDFIRADKYRDLHTGNIVETRVFADSLEGEEVTIYDDICDGGRTFIELAKVLKDKEAAKVNLFVTHGIFSRGYQNVLNGGVDHIYTTNSLPQTKHKDVSVIEL